ncbi:hypothetical protein E2C01_055677 [Portunus trituberculatus]|uniref:Uncharacterized protein n=1 Tax=Portunus trituberculatus TaxID=210409 RepID=A0A5B7GVF4_PORTR|nr:hypothetical protein [Portunus trituberculatus]
MVEREGVWGRRSTVTIQRASCTKTRSLASPTFAFCRCNASRRNLFAGPLGEFTGGRGGTGHASYHRFPEHAPSSAPPLPPPPPPDNFPPTKGVLALVVAFHGVTLHAGHGHGLSSLYIVQGGCRPSRMGGCGVPEPRCIVARSGEEGGQAHEVLKVSHHLSSQHPHIHRRYIRLHWR